MHELRQLLDDVADVDWRHPLWWALVGGTAALEALAGPGGAADLYAAYLAANGGPRSDTFMARDRTDGERSPDRIVAGAVARAYAAAAVLAELDHAFPGQPLRRALGWDGGWLVRRPLPAGPPLAVFLTHAGAHVAPLAPGGEAALARALGALLAGRAAGTAAALRRIDPRDLAPAPAAIAVSLQREPIGLVRHLHRRAWTRGGGPWLGLGDAVGDAGPLAVTTTGHLAVDGFGHARVTAEIFGRLDRLGAAELAALVACAREGLAGAAPPVELAPAAAGEELGFAARLLRGAAPDFPAAAWAFGCALERVYRAEDPAALRRRARHSPAFQAAIAPGGPADAARLRRRVVFGLLSVPMVDGVPMPADRFRAHLRPLLAREAEGGGFLSRLGAAVLHAPLPAPLRRRLLSAAGRPHPLLPMIEVLAGRGRLSTLRFPPGEAPPAPLYAASSPGLFPSPRDGRGGVVLTLVHHAGACTASLCGTGLAATTRGARAVLDAWLEALAARAGGQADEVSPGARRRPPRRPRPAS